MCKCNASLSSVASSSRPLRCFFNYAFVLRVVPIALKIDNKIYFRIHVFYASFDFYIIFTLQIQNSLTTWFTTDEPSSTHHSTPFIKQHHHHHLPRLCYCYCCSLLPLTAADFPTINTINIKSRCCRRRLRHRLRWTRWWWPKSNSLPLAQWERLRRWPSHSAVSIYIVNKSQLSTSLLSIVVRLFSCSSQANQLEQR